MIDETKMKNHIHVVRSSDDPKFSRFLDNYVETVAQAGAAYLFSDEKSSEAVIIFNAIRRTTNSKEGTEAFDDLQMFASDAFTEGWYQGVKYALSVKEESDAALQAVREYYKEHPEKLEEDSI